MSAAPAPRDIKLAYVVMRSTASEAIEWRASTSRKAAVAIDQQFGRAAMLTYARASDDMAVKMFAAQVVDTIKTINLITEWVAIEVAPEGDKIAVRRIKARIGRLMRRIDKLLADGLARLLQSTRPTGERDTVDPISHRAREAEPQP